MKKIIVLSVIISLFSVLAFAQDKELVKVPLENYMKGMATGNSEFLLKAFYPESRIVNSREGKFVWRATTDFAKSFTGKPAADEASRKRWIEWVEVTGNAAVAKVILDYPKYYFIDYLALLKIEGEWKIVSKTSYAKERKGSAEKANFTVAADVKKAVALPLENYIKAQAAGDGEAMRKAIYGEAKLMFSADGKYNQWSAEEYAARFNGRAAAADEDKRKRSFEILDVAESEAIARVTLDYPTVKFTDYMILLKIDGEWRIANKIFYRESKEQPKKAN